MKWYLPATLIALFSILSCSNSEEKSVYDSDISIDLSERSFTEDGEQHVIPVEVQIPEDGRYAVRVYVRCDSCVLWLEDYVDNKDDRTYNVTGDMVIDDLIRVNTVMGSPFAAGTHNMKLHCSDPAAVVNRLEMNLIKEHKASPQVINGTTEGDDWSLVWSDEFDYEGHADTTKWTYDIGDWGWGNNELQYYTELDTQNAYVSNGTLKITGRQADNGNWTSARLTTRGKTAFTYGKIEFRAKVPTDRGTWSAGWLLGNSYLDEISWPYCGEIDVLECVGYEINDSTGAGFNHGTCHTPKYYFKKGNQISAIIAMDSMHAQFHTYAVEWDEKEVRAYVDGEHYYTYDKNADELEWPFDQPQNIIINLAIGGGWGGLKGLDPNMTDPTYELDYVRVYNRVDSSEL